MKTDGDESGVECGYAVNVSGCGCEKVQNDDEDKTRTGNNANRALPSELSHINHPSPFVWMRCVDPLQFRFFSDIHLSNLAKLLIDTIL